jgi:hypothetical protein
VVDAGGPADSAVPDVAPLSDTQWLAPDERADEAVTSPVDRGTAEDSGITPDTWALPDAGTAPDEGAAPDAEAVLDGGGGPGPDAGPDTVPRPPVTIVVLPDTQYYAYSNYASVFGQQTGWVVAQKSILNIAAVLHVGDVVDIDAAEQWTVANPAMRLLDNVVPYVVVPGNHDYSGPPDRATMMNDYFAPASMPWITGTMTPGKIENNYAILDIGPQKWLVLGLEFGPRDAVVNWASRVLRENEDKNKYPVILLTHAYLYQDADLYKDGARYDITAGGIDSTKSNYQYWSPYFYGFTASEGINDGEQMWQKLVLPNSKVRLVFCGHQTGWAHLTSTRPDGTTVHQMLSDYQWLPGPEGDHFGYGYLRIVQLDYDRKKIQVSTYSPYLGAYMDDDQNRFTLDLNL